MPTHGERTVWGRGDSRDLKVFKTSVGTVGGLICYRHYLSPCPYYFLRPHIGVCIVS